MKWAGRESRKIIPLFDTKILFKRIILKQDGKLLAPLLLSTFSGSKRVKSLICRKTLSTYVWRKEKLHWKIDLTSRKVFHHMNCNGTIDRLRMSCTHLLKHFFSLHIASSFHALEKISFTQVLVWWCIQINECTFSCQLSIWI